MTATEVKPATGRAAWWWCGLTLALAATAAALAGANGSAPAPVLHLLFVTACALVGGLICARRPGHMVGRLLALSSFCFALYEATGQYAILGLITHPGLPLAAPLAWPQTWLWVPANTAAALVPLFFPGGRLPSASLRPWPAAAVAVAAVVAVLSALRPGPDTQVGAGAGVPNPLGVPALAPVAPVLEPVLDGVLVAVFAVGAAGLGRRLLRSDGPERRQVAWLLYGAGIEALVIGARLVAGLTDDVPGSVWPAHDPVWELIAALGAALVPVTIGVAILRHRLFDIDLVINRTLVYVLLSGCVTGGYVLVVGYLGALFPAQDLPISVGAAGLVALAFAPLRQRLQGWVNLLTYGEADDPYAALTRLGRRLENAAGPDAGLSGIARSIAEALRLPYAAVETAGGERHAYTAPGPAATGDAGLTRLPLTHNGRQVGGLILRPRPGETGFGPRDLRVLADLARQVAVAVHAARLSADLRRSRERLVMAREEERRRLRRDLHDGLGPTLAALTMRAEAAHDLAADERVRELLADIVGDAEAALADVRTLVEGLRPPALDSLGLAGALRAHAARQPSGLRVEVHAPDDVPVLPAATEVAAYRIASEALANTRRHAGATYARLRIELAGGRLNLEICDDGRGIGRRESAAAGLGVGLASMRERALELGGSCTVEERPGGGTRVRVELPAGGRGNGDDQDLGG
ncbi:sensor histidine kinase [Nonomuraea ceibae]|uniref:sensor histidine kinase n=1 Tax=Nonomuraea ceibae TaxID=1935170 RepID=UPI001C5EC32E|nr:histidine kinase [Nonomuraea ceibae]